MDNKSSQFLLIKRENLCVLSHTHTQWFILGLEERGEDFDILVHLVLYALIKYLLNKVKVREKFEVSFYPSMPTHKHLRLKPIPSGKLKSSTQW